MQANNSPVSTNLMSQNSSEALEEDDPAKPSVREKIEKFNASTTVEPSERSVKEKTKQSAFRC